MIKRDLYLNRIRPFINKDIVKVITGIRRCGKSILLELIKQELQGMEVPEQQILSYNFESMSLRKLCTAEALYEDIISKTKTFSGKAYLFFDEIQEVEEWERVVNSLRVDMDCDIYITGSNARLLSGELATLLAGRYAEFVIYPFSFSEFFMMYRETFPSSTEAEAFQKYLIFGGMPYLGALGYDAEASRQYLQDLYNSVELKDIIKRNRIRDVDLLERILLYTTSNAGNTFSAGTVSKYLKSEGRTVAPETVLNYLHAALDAFLFYKIKRNDLVGKKMLSVQEKYYLADHGIREAIIGGNLKDINLILENIVFLELIRHGYTVTVGKCGDKEIDFIGQKAAEKIYIQVCYLLAAEETIRREFGVYANVKDNYPKYVLSMDELDFSQNGIRHENIRHFLLRHDW